MNKMGIWVLAVILMVAAGCAPKANAPEDVAAIKALMAEWGQTASSGDASALAAYYTDDAVRMNMNAPILVGKEAIRSDWQSTLDRYTHIETDVAEDVHVVGDFAVARGTYTGKSTPKLPGGAVLNEKGKQVYVYRRQPGGAWKMIMDIWSSDLPVVETLGPASADELALLQIERDWSAAWLKQDAAALDAILADEFIENWRGEISTKAKVLANIKAGIYKVEACENSDMRVVVFGDHAVVNGLNRGKQSLRGKDVEGADRWMDTFIKRDGRWRPVFSHLIKVE
jgi:uncharacterized protein (TIGR02246 family)